MQKNPNAKLHLEISNAFARLTPDPKAKKTEANQGTFDAAADSIIMLSKIPTTHKVPRHFFKDEAATMKELTQLLALFSRFGNTLSAQIPSLNSDAVIAIGGTEPLLELSNTVLSIGTRFEHILKKIKSSEESKNASDKAGEQSSDTTKARHSGAPSNLRAQMIAQTVASYYQRITGKRATVIKYNYSDPPTPGGAYYNLLDNIFKIIKMEVSVEHHAREAAKKLRLLSR